MVLKSARFDVFQGNSRNFLKKNTPILVNSKKWLSATVTEPATVTLFRFLIKILMTMFCEMTELNGRKFQGRLVSV